MCIKHIECVYLTKYVLSICKQLTVETVCLAGENEFQKIQGAFLKGLH